ncbi:glutamine cyclotransferase [Sphingobacteriaceae bacterium]|nr:glutamine cyclotransferase [Sphingobacteriaceae bacterium]
MKIQKNLPIAIGIKKISFLALICLIAYACGTDKKETPENTQPVAKTVPAISYSIVKTYPHDTTAFTEGLLFNEGQLFESTGDVDYLPQTKSALGIVNLETGKLDLKVEIDKTAHFGEGMVILNGKIYQVTLDSHVGFVYDAKTYKKIDQFNYQNEGWGLTTDGKSIIMSNGTFNLTYINPLTYAIEKTVAVTEQGYGLDHLNELEYIKGFIYANVWMTNYVVKINPETGEVVGKLDLDDLNVKSREKQPRSLEMNGIAYDAISDKILVTGKLWPNIYEISFPH